MQNNTRKTTLYIIQLGMIAAIMTILNLTGIGIIKIGPVSAQTLLIAVIIGAIVLGPAAGAILGGLFGFFVLRDPDTAFFLNLEPVWTIILCFVVRGVGLGYLCGVLAAMMRKIDRIRKIDQTSILSYALVGVLTALLNTFMFIFGASFIFTYSPDVQNLLSGANTPGAAMFAWLGLVGIQALGEAALCAVIPSAVAKALKTYVK